MKEGPPKNAPQDLLHAQQLQHDLAIINARTVRELGPLPAGGLPLVRKRRPDVPRPSPQTPMLATIGTETLEEDPMYWSKIAASTALAAVAALTACGVEGAPDEPTETATADIAPVLAAAEITAVSAAQTETAPQAAAPAVVQGPTIPAAQLRRQILDLIDSIQGPEDMSRAQVERMMAVKLRQQSGSPDDWSYEGNVDAGWGYGITIEEGRKEGLPIIVIGFTANDAKQNQRASICSYDLEELADEVVARGYTRFPRWAQPRAHLVFDRDLPDLSFGVAVQMFKYVQQIGPDPEQYRYCAQTIYITAGVPFRD